MQKVEGAASGTHDAVARLLEQKQTRGALLDAPCGVGALSARALKMGFEVTGVDLVKQDNLRLQEDRFVKVDLNQGLPFEPGSFDVVVSVEGIEHLDNPRAFVAQLARALKPGGRLIISTPNVLNVRSRWRWFSRGYHKHFTPQTDGRFSSDHLHAIDLFLLRRFLSDAGLQIVQVRANRLLRGLKERLFGWWIRSRTPRALPARAQLLSDEVLFGEILVVEAVQGG